MVRKKRTYNSNNKSTKKPKVLSEQSAADLTFKMKSTNEKLDQGDFQKKGPTTSDIQGPKTSDSDNVCLFRCSLRSSSTSKLCCDAVETKNKTVETNKKDIKTLDSSGDFNEKRNSTNVKSFPSKKLTHVQEKVAGESNIIITRKKKLAAITSLTEFTDKISCDIEPKSKDNELCKSFVLHESITEKIHFNPDKETVKSLSPNELTSQSSESSSNINLISNLNCIIDKVKNLQIEPCIHVYSIMLEGNGLCAFDVSYNLSHLAYSFPHSHEFHVCARKSLSEDIARKDIISAYKNYISAKNQLNEGEESGEILASPQEYLIQHDDDISGLRFSLDGNFLLSCSLDGSVKVVSTTTYQVLEHYRGFGRCTDIDINSNMTQFATTNNYHQISSSFLVYVYDFSMKSPISCIDGHEKFLKCVRYHPNGLYIATAAADNCIKLWSVSESKEVRHFKDDEIDHAFKLAFSPDGKYLASTHSGCVKIWDLATGKKLTCLKSTSFEACTTWNVTFDYSGNMLAAGGSDKKIHIWNITSDKSSEESSHYDLLKSEYLGKTIFSIKYVSNFFSCVTG